MEGRPTWVRYQVLAWLCLSATIAYVQRNSISVAESSIRADLNLSKVESGLMMSAFFITYAVFQLPTGWLSGLMGSRLGLTVFTTIWSIFTAAMAAAQGAVGLIAARLGMGGVQAAVFPCATQSIAHWFPSTRRGVASGALGGFMSVGGFIGALLTGYLIVYLGWRLLFVLYALPGILWAAGFWFWFRDRPEQHRGVNQAELALIRAGQPPSTGDGKLPPTPWKTILSSPAMWLIGGQQFFRAAGYIFFASWFATYLQESRGVSIPGSGLLTAMPVIAVAIGSLLGGGLTDWVYHVTGSLRMARQGVGAGSLMLCALLILPAYLVENPLLAVVLISAGSFSAAFAGPCAYAISIDLGGRHVTTVFSFMNMCGNVGAAVFPLAVPLLVETMGSWDSVLFLFAGIYVAASLCWMLFDARRPIVT